LPLLKVKRSLIISYDSLKDTDKILQIKIIII